MPARHIVRVVDFSETPGARHYSDGPDSGQEFREKVLVPAFQAALGDNAVLLVDLDGAFGYATSFLEEAFGGLAEKFGSQIVDEHIELKSDDEPSLKDEVHRYIRSGVRGSARGAHEAP